MVWIAGLGVATELASPGSALAEYERVEPYAPRTSERGCSPIDLRDSTPGLGQFFHQPRDQSDIGWCYAYTVADLITQKVGTPVSATDLAINYNFHVQDNFFTRWFRALGGHSADKTYEGGMPRDLGIYAIEDGFCSEKEMPSTLTGRTRARVASIDFFQKGILYCLDMQKQGKDPNQIANTWIETKVNQMTVGESCRGVLAALFPRLSPTQAYSTKITEDDNQNSLLYKIAQPACDKRMRLPEDTAFVQRFKSPDGNATSLFSELDEQLRLGQMVEVTYRSSAVTKSGTGGSHASLVVARQFRDGACKYLVRNSWGPGCWFYNAEIAKDCLDAEGAYWISEKELGEAATALTFIR